MTTAIGLFVSLARALCRVALTLAPRAAYQHFNTIERSKGDNKAQGPSAKAKKRRELAEEDAAAFGFILALMIVAAVMVVHGVYWFFAGSSAPNSPDFESSSSRFTQSNSASRAMTPSDLTELMQMNEDLHKRALHNGAAECADAFVQALKTSMEPRAAQARATVEGVFNALEAETALDREVLQQGLEQSRMALSHMRMGVLRDLDEGVKEQKRAWEDLSHSYETTLRRVNTALMTKLGTRANRDNIDKLLSEHWAYHMNGAQTVNGEPVRVNNLVVLGPPVRQTGDLFFAKVSDVLGDQKLAEAARTCVKSPKSLQGNSVDLKKVLSCGNASQKDLINAIGLNVSESVRDDALLSILRVILLHKSKLEKLKITWESSSGHVEKEKRVLKEIHSLAKSHDIPHGWIVAQET